MILCIDIFSKEEDGGWRCTRWERGDTPCSYWVFNHPILVDPKDWDWRMIILLLWQRTSPITILIATPSFVFRVFSPYVNRNSKVYWSVRIKTLFVITWLIVDPNIQETRGSDLVNRVISLVLTPGTGVCGSPMGELGTQIIFKNFKFKYFSPQSLLYHTPNYFLTSYQIIK